jgi:hypothetical protein
MKGYILAIIALIATGISGCTQSLSPAFIDSTEKGNEILCMSARTPCYGKCPVYSITIYKNGLIKKYNRRFTDDDGATYYGILDKSALKELQTKALDAGFLQMDSVYPTDKTVVDLPGWNTEFNLNGIHKKVMNRGLGAPEALVGLQQFIDDLAKKYAITKQNP